MCACMRTCMRASVCFGLFSWEVKVEEDLLEIT